jgi:hypothetical protein
MRATCTLQSDRPHPITARVPPDSASELPVPRYALPNSLRGIQVSYEYFCLVSRDGTRLPGAITGHQCCVIIV